MGGDEAELTPAVLARFTDYPWPGNVRELYNAVARTLALGDLAHSDLGALRSPDAGAAREDVGQGTAGGAGARDAEGGDVVAEVLAMNLGLVESRERVVRDFERRYLRYALERHGGNVTRAAASAGVARRYFHQLLSRQGRTSDRE
jgi:DNA-binding NtrC family response regulator